MTLALWHLVVAWLLEKKCSATLEILEPDIIDILEISSVICGKSKDFIGFLSLNPSEFIWIRRACHRPVGTASSPGGRSWGQLPSHPTCCASEPKPGTKPTKKPTKLCGFAWYFDRYFDIAILSIAIFKSSMKLSLRFFASWVKPEGTDEVRAWSALKRSKAIVFWCFFVLSLCTWHDVTSRMDRRCDLSLRLGRLGPPLHSQTLEKTPASVLKTCSQHVQTPSNY